MLLWFWGAVPWLTTSGWANCAKSTLFRSRRYSHKVVWLALGIWPNTPLLSLSLWTIIFTGLSDFFWCDIWPLFETLAITGQKQLYSHCWGIKKKRTKDKKKIYKNDEQDVSQVSVSAVADWLLKMCPQQQCQVHINQKLLSKPTTGSNKHNGHQ